MTSSKIRGGAKVPVVLYGDNGSALTIDPESGGIVAIDTVHYRAHQGQLFTASYISANASPIADDGTRHSLSN